MTNNGRRLLLEAIRPRYLTAGRPEKTQMMNGFVAVTGYHRKHAIRLLRRGVKQGRQKKRGRRG
jgi:hypothetical protein